MARGFTQTYGVDYGETFSPVARLSSIRILFSIAVNKEWTLSQLDVRNAFLYGDLTEEVPLSQKYLVCHYLLEEYRLHIQQESYT